MNDSTITQMLQVGQRDLDWFDSNLNMLKNKFNNKFVAFNNCDVVDSDADLEKLMQKLKVKNADTSNTLIRFVSKVKSIL